MKDLLDKLTSYNLYNYLLPGIIFVVLLKELTSFSFVQENLVIGVFVYYFIGLIISRIGSLVIEPILKWTNFIKFGDYSRFVLVSKKDSKIETLSEVNNSYRTISSMFILLLALKFYETLVFKFTIQESTSKLFLIILLLTLFLFSYRKQTKYITARILGK